MECKLHLLDSGSPVAAQAFPFAGVNGDRSAAPQMFDTSSCSNYEMQWSYCPTLQGRVLRVVMHQVKHSVPIDVLNHLFCSYGVVEKIFLSSNQHGCTILIQYQHDYMANNALRATHGWYLYSTYCQLDVRHAYPAELQIIYDYSCAFLAEINTSEQKLTHEVAMPQVEAIDDLCSVIPHLKRNNSEQHPHVIQQLLAQAKAQLETISEKLRHAIVQNNRGTIWDCIEKNAASKPLLAREDINLNCPTQQAVVEPECVVGDADTEDSSHAFVQVFTDTPEQQRYAVEQHESRQAPKCFSMPIFSPERPTVGDIDQLLNCPSRASEYRTWDEEFQDDENSLWEKSVCQPATGHSISIFPWDPGACVSTYPSWHPQFLIQQEGTVTHAPLLVHSRPTETIQPCTIQGVPAVTNCQVPALDRKCQQVPSDHAPSNETGCLTKIEWQPHHGIGTLSLYFCLRGLIATSVIGKQLSQLQISELEKWERQVTSVSYAWDPGIKIFLCSWLTIVIGWSATDTQFLCTHITSVATDVTPVLCFKANNTAGSGSRLLPSLKLPMNVQGVQNNYKAKNLLSSPHYLQIKFNGVALWLFHSLPP